MPDIFTSQATKSVRNAQQKTPVTNQPQTVLGKSMPFFATMFKNPAGVSFANQDADEVVILFLRRDFITNFRWIFIVVLFLLLPPVLAFLNDQFLFTTFSFPPNFQTILTLLYYTIVVGYALFSFLSWFYNISIATNKEVLDIEFVNLISKNVSQATFDSVQDIKYKQGGFLQSFFNYGLVTVVTEGIRGDINFESVPRPGEVAGIIQDLKNSYTANR